MTEPASRNSGDILRAVNARMTGGGCPTPGCIGECAAITHEGGNRYVAHLYLWDATFNDSAQVAQWFKDAGASMIWISHTLYSDHNDDRDGLCGGSHHRNWNVSFELGAAAPRSERGQNDPLARVFAALKKGPKPEYRESGMERGQDYFSPAESYNDFNARIVGLLREAAPSAERPESA